jgi:Tol biopolymer transport system component
MTRQHASLFAFISAIVLLAACDQDGRVAPDPPLVDPPLTDPRGLILTATIAYPAEIYVMRSDGSGLRQLTRDSANDLDPRWSPDGRLIIFSRATDVVGGNTGSPDIWVMNPDGSNKRVLYHGVGQEHEPAYSPDGRYIAFAQSDPGIGLRVHVINADGTGERLVTQSAESRAPDWRPDGSRILFLGTRASRSSRSIYTALPDGTDEQLVGGDAACVGNIQEARWSPDGGRIAYRCDDAPGGAIFVIHADGTSRVRLSPVSPGPNYDFDRYPVWSPDGRQIAYMSVHYGDPTGPWVMDTTGANRTRLDLPATAGLVPLDWGAVTAGP